MTLFFGLVIKELSLPYFDLENNNNVLSLLSFGLLIAL
jgi:hypothetical protein